MRHESVRYGALSSDHCLSIEQTAVNVVAERALVAVVMGAEIQRVISVDPARQIGILRKRYSTKNVANEKQPTSFDGREAFCGTGYSTAQVQHGLLWLKMHYHGP